MTLVDFERELAQVLSAPPVEWPLDLEPPFEPVALYEPETGTIATVHRMGGLVRAFLATEARILVVDLDPRDAMTLSERIAANEKAK